MHEEQQGGLLPLNDSRTRGVAGRWSWVGVAGQAPVSREAQRRKPATGIVGGAEGPGSRLGSLDTCCEGGIKIGMCEADKGVLPLPAFPTCNSDQGTLVSLSEQIA